MKNKKLIIGLSAIAIIIIISIITILMINSKKEIKFDNDKYISIGQFYEKVMQNDGLYSQNYSDEDIENSEDYKIFADILLEWAYITKKQAQNLDNPLTRELAAYVMINSLVDKETHNIDIEDIKKCENKQAIKDAVGMKIFELENNKFNPKGYVTYEEADEIIEKKDEFISGFHYSDDETISADKWTDLKITLNKKEYNFTKNTKVSDFVNNGWKATYGGETLNQTIEELKKAMENSDMLYIGYNSVYLEQDNLSLDVYFDMSITSSKVIDSRVTAITIYNKEENKLSDFDFYGLKLGSVMTEKQYKEKFGTKNFAMLEDDINNYYRKSIELADDFEIGLEFTTRVETNKLVSITISEN